MFIDNCWFRSKRISYLLKFEGFESVTFFRLHCPLLLLVHIRLYHVSFLQAQLWTFITTLQLIDCLLCMVHRRYLLQDIFYALRR